MKRNELQKLEPVKDKIEEGILSKIPFIGKRFPKKDP